MATYVVTGPNDNDIPGGIFTISDDTGSWQWQHILAGDYRGIVQIPNGYIVAEKTRLIRYDRAWTVQAQSACDSQADFHGVAWLIKWALTWDRAFWFLAMETGRNTIGIYDGWTMIRVGEILLNTVPHDDNHYNDLSVQGDIIYVSCFALAGHWYENILEPGGGIIAFPSARIRPYKRFLVQDPQIVQRGLYMPHSVQLIRGSLAYCESMRLRVCFTADYGDYDVPCGGWTRGLLADRDRLLIGQSTMRQPHRETFPRDVDLRAGVHIVEQTQNVFIPLPPEYLTTQVYSIIPAHAPEKPQRSER